MEDKQQRNLRHYHHQARLLLTERERDLLHDMLKEYQKYHNARQFVSDLRSILNTPAKMDLLREIRNLVPPTYLQEFDTLAPYDRMAHPMVMHLMQDAPVFKRSPSWHGRAYERTCDTQSEDLDMNHYVSTEPRVLNITNKNEDLGFTIKGGSEQGTPVSVSRVEKGSEAEKNGLAVGDEILEVNNINFEEIAISSAIRVLQGSKRLRMTVQHNPALAQHSQRRQSKEKTKWFDTYSRSRGPPAGLNTSPPALNRERKVIIQLDEKHRFIGFNIRGGSEYGLGIFVSKTDRGGMAEYYKIQVGDQILSVNGTSCENISHAAAVDLIRGQKRLVLIVRSMGPDNLNQSQNKSHRPQSTTPSMISADQQQQKSPPFPNGPVPPIPKQNKDWLTRAPAHGGVQRLDVKDMKTKQSLGENVPVIMSARQNNQGGPHLSNTTITDHLPSRPPSAQSQQSTQRTQPYPQPHPQAHPQAHPQPHPQQQQQQHLRQSTPRPPQQVVAGWGGDSGGKEKKRGLGRSLSVKHPGERRLPVMEQSPKSKQVKVKRNKTFRALFGLKPKVKGHEKEEHHGGGNRRSPEREILPPPSPKKVIDQEILAESFEEDLARVDPIGQEAGANEEDLGVVGVEKEGKRHRKGKSKMTGIIASFRKTRPEGIVKKRHNIALPPDEEQERPPSADRPGSATSWASRKDSLGESLSNSSHGSLGKQKGAFMAGAGTQIMHAHAASASQMPILSEVIKKTLNEDEAAAVHRHIKRYHTEGDVDSLVTPLLAILDKPEKTVLLREVRGVIAPLDLAVFDSMVSRRELEARNYLNAKSGSVSPRLSYDRKVPQDQLDSNQAGTSNNNERKTEKLKRHQNELDRLRKQRQEEVRQAKLTATGRSLDVDPSPYGQIGYPANQSRHGSFDTYSQGERRDQAPPAFSTFKGVASGGGSGGGSPASSISDGSLSKKTAKRVLINAAPQIIRTNSTGDDDVSPRSDEGDGVKDNGFEDRFGRGRHDHGSGWDPYETIPIDRLGDENDESPKIQNNEFATRGQVSRDSGAMNNDDFDPPYATIKTNPLTGHAHDATDANESDHDSVDSDYSVGKKNGMYRIMGSDTDENWDDRGSPSSPSKSMPHKLSPIPASPPSPRIIAPTPPSSPLAASQNLDVLLQVRRDQVSTPNHRDGTSSNRSSGSSSDDPIYAQVTKGAAKTPANFLDVRDYVDSASESESGGKRVSFSDFNCSPKPPRKGILKNSFNRDERPSVPIRNPQLYLDDDDDDEPSPLKEIIRSRRGKSPIKPAARRRIDGFPGREIFEFELSKSQSSLGLSLTGGKDYKNQPYVKVDRIYPGGAVADDGNLTSGCVLVGVDGVSLLDVSHHQAMDIIRSAYKDKSKKTMQIEFMDVL